MEGMWTRFFPAVVKAKELVASGAIGRVVAVHADFGFVCGDDPSSRMFAPELAGGGLLDIGVYPIAMASLAYGGVAPLEVKASGTKHPTTGVDTSAGITALYGDPAAHPDLPNMPEGAPGNFIAVPPFDCCSQERSSLPRDKRVPTLTFSFCDEVLMCTSLCLM